MSKKLNRRSFLRLGALGTLATGLSGKQAIAASASAQGKASAKQSQVVGRYVPLGKTGLEVADVSFGSSRLREGEEKLVHHALDRGINYFDTAESYSDGYSESVLGNALRGIRDETIIATKLGAGANDSQTSMMQALEGSLQRLRTDHVEIIFNHAVNTVSKLKNTEWFEFVDRAKQQGKIRFTGISGHAGRLVECVDYAIDQEMVDVVLVAYNFGQDPAFYDRFTRTFDFVANQPGLPEVLARAKQKEVGVIAMKVLRGARLNDMRPFEVDGSTFAQAAIRWVLSSSTVDAAIISMTSAELIDEYVGGSGGQVTNQQDFELLEQYARLTDSSYCRHACNECESSCPLDVSISDVLRTRMYATDYADVRFARSEYAQVGNNASACLSCDGQPCQGACPHGIPIAKLCGPTHIMLS